MKLLKKVRNWRLIIVILVVLILSYNILAQTFNTLKSESRLAEATNELNRLQRQNQELKKRLTEVKSPEFIEQQARDKLGLAKSGETVVIIPDKEIEKVLGVNTEVEEVKLPNWQGWLRLFFP